MGFVWPRPLDCASYPDVNKGVCLTPEAILKQSKSFPNVSSKFYLNTSLHNRYPIQISRKLPLLSPSQVKAAPLPKAEVRFRY